MYYSHKNNLFSVSTNVANDNRTISWNLLNFTDECSLEFTVDDRQLCSRITRFLSANRKLTPYYNYQQFSFQYSSLERIYSNDFISSGRFRYIHIDETSTIFFHILGCDYNTDAPTGKEISYNGCLRNRIVRATTAGGSRGRNWRRPCTSERSHTLDSRVDPSSAPGIANDV